MSYTDRIKQLIESVVKANNNQEITGQKLQNVLIAMLDATEETYRLIDSLEVGGVALLQTLGDSETMGISQKVLTEYITKTQEQISQEISNREQAISALETELKGYTDAEVEAAEQTVQNNINAEQARAEAAEQSLRETYAGLTQTDIEVVATLPNRGVPNKIYRLVGATTFSDYQFNASDLSIPVLLATYDVSMLEAQNGYYECQSAGNASDKAIVANNFVMPATGGSLKVKMINKNTANNVRLVINSDATSAKAIFYNGSAVNAANTWESGETVNIYFDGIQWQAFNVANRQDVDDEPTAGSENLVKSKGVYNAINLFSHSLANRVIKELYIPNVNYTAFTKISVWLCHLYNEKYYNIIRLFVSNEDYFYLYQESFDTEEEALADMVNNMNGLYERQGQYVILSVSPDLAGTNIIKEDFTINRDIANLNNSPVIKESLDKVSLEASIIGKEALANKVSAWSQIPTDAHYPSEKLVHDTILTPLNSISKTTESGSKNLYDYEHVGVLSGVIATNGTVTQNYDGFYTGKIPVEPNHYYYLSNRGSRVARSVRCLDINDNVMKVLAPSNGEEYSSYYLPNVDATDNVLNGQFKTPANAAYIQINLTPLDVTEIGNYYQIMLEDVGDVYNPDFVPSEYEPYNYATIIKDESLQYPVKPLAEMVDALANKSIITVKLLCVGSSFTQDEFGYLPFILSSIAPNVKLTIGIAYIGGSPLPQHLAYLTHADSEHRIESDGVAYWVEDGASKPYKKLHIANSELTEYAGYILYKSVNTEPWSSLGSMLIEDVLTNEDWDIVTYQGSASQAFKSWDDYYAPYIFEIVKQVNAKVGDNIKLAFNLIHSGYASSDEEFLSRWLETAKNAKKVLQQTGFSLLFPSGTAIQNLRHIDALRAMGDNTYHNLLVDTAHLQDGIGPLCTAYANALILLKEVGIDYEGVIGEGTRPDSAWITDNNIPGPSIGSGVIGITDDYCLLAQIAATNAVKYPYSIINPSVSAPYTDRDTGNKAGISKNELSTDVQTSLNKADSAYQKPSSGIPASDIASGVIPDVSNFITVSVNNLTNYYLKSETYTKAEVANLISAIQQFHYEVYASISDVTDPADNVLYLIGPASVSGTDKYEEYVYANNSFVKIGDTSINLSGYATIAALNSALTSLRSALENGEIIPAMAGTLEPWADQKAIATPDTYADAVRTAGGDIPIETSAGSKIESIKPVAGSKWTAKMLFNGSYNMLNAAKWGAANSQPYVGSVGSDFVYFLVPELALGIFGTADENNGLLFTDSEGENVQPASMYFKALSTTVPQSLTDGTLIAPTTISYDGKTYKDYATDGAGWLIVPKAIYDNDICAHIAWEDWYDKHISLNEPTTNPEAIVGILILEGLLALAHSDKYLRGINEEVCDNVVFGDTSAIITHMVDELEIAANAWTNAATGESDSHGNALYRHSATVSGIKQGGAACIEGEDGGISLTVNGTTVSYIDTNDTVANAQTVFYEVTATSTTKAYTDSVFNGSNIDTETGILPINDCSIEAQVAMDGEANITVKYAKNIVDQVAINATVDVPQIKKQVEEHEERITELEDTAVRTGSYDASVAVGLADNFKGDTVVEAEFYKRKTGGTQSVGSGIAAIKEVRGKSLVWNQLIRHNTSSATNNGITFQNMNDGSWKISGTATDTALIILSADTFAQVNEHIYFIKISNSDLDVTIRPQNHGGFDCVTSTSKIFKCTQDGNNQKLGLRVNSGITINDAIVYPRLFDLTFMFGEGKEPATVEEFEKMFPLDYYDYNAGEVIPFAGQNLVTTGFNQWDEEWEIGSIDYTTGKPTPDNRYIRSKNFVPVLENTTYYVGNNLPSDGLCCYDANKNFIGKSLHLNYLCTLLPKTSFVKFRTTANYGNTYKSDICINISNEDRNGIYEPYEKHTLPLDPSQWRDKQGNLVFPYGGMHGVGTAYDYAKVDADGYIRKAVRAYERVDLGSLGWNIDNSYGFVRFISSDALPSADVWNNCICGKYSLPSSSLGNNQADKTVKLYNTNYVCVRDSSYETTSTFKAAMQGVPLIYNLAEPVEVELATPVYAKYLVDKDGTEEITPANGTKPYTTMANLSILYAMDARGEIKNLPKNYLSKESAENMLNAMVTAGIITSYTMTWDATNARYQFTIVAPAQSNE